MSPVSTMEDNSDSFVFVQINERTGVFLAAPDLV